MIIESRSKLELMKRACLSHMTICVRTMNENVNRGNGTNNVEVRNELKDIEEMLDGIDSALKAIELENE